MNAKRALWIGACGILLWAGAAQAAPIKKNFRQDMDYYYKLSKAKGLGANDRLFVLNRLRDKYKAVEFDVTELYAEIDKWSGTRQKEIKAETANQAPAAMPTPAETVDAAPPIPAEQALQPGAPAQAAPEAAKATPETIGNLTKMTARQQKNLTQIILNAPGLEDYKEVPVADENGGEPAATVLYLYHTRNKIPAKARVLKPQKGFVREATAKIVTAKPPTTKVSIAFRKSLPYDITRTGDQLILTVYNRAPMVEVPAPTPVEMVEDAEQAAMPEEADAAPANLSEALAPIPFDALPSTRPVEGGTILTVDFVKYGGFSRMAVAPLEGGLEFHPVGTVAVTGNTPEQLGKSIGKKLAELELDSKVEAAAKTFNAQENVALIGNVKSPGAYRYRNKLGAFDLIMRSGGFQPGADKKGALVHRKAEQGRKTLAFDIEAFMESPNPANDFLLQKGDVVEIRKTAEIYVYGQVQSPGFYKMKEPYRLNKMLAAAGGLTKTGDESRIVLFRRENGDMKKQTFDLNSFPQNPEFEPVIKEGDLILAPAKKTRSKFLNKETMSWGGFFISLGLVLALLV